jgi:hypothetical protein
MAGITREETWLKSTTPSSLLRTLKGKRMPRRRRLFAVACCRRFLKEMADQESRQAVEVAERFADGAASREELEDAYRASERLLQLRECQLPPPEQGEQWDVWRLAHAAHLSCAPKRMERASAVILKRVSSAGKAQRKKEATVHANLIRDIFGNPFRPLPPVAPGWLEWNGGTVVRLAGAIYEDRAFERLPILADALEEAGCDRPELLEHFRHEGPHARGCWALDLVRSVD